MRRAARPLPANRRIALVGAIAVLAAANFQLFLLTDWTMLRGGIGADWAIFLEASRRIDGGGLYAVENEYAFRYSPLLAVAFGLIEPIGALGWRMAHVLAALSLAWIDRRLAVFLLLSWPFWFDVEAGNLVTFVFVLAAWSLTGRRVGIAGYLALALLAPRPLALPVVGWLLWRHPEWRIPFVAMFAGHAILVAVTGWGPDWILALVGSTAEVDSVLNFGPSRLIGWIWIPIGAALALFFTLRGRLGWASLAASPYWLPYYLMMPLLELIRPSAREAPMAESESGAHRAGT